MVDTIRGHDIVTTAVGMAKDVIPVDPEKGLFAIYINGRPTSFELPTGGIPRDELRDRLEAVIRGNVRDAAEARQLGVAEPRSNTSIRYGENLNQAQMADLKEPTWDVTSGVY